MIPVGSAHRGRQRNDLRHLPIDYPSACAWQMMVRGQNSNKTMVDAFTVHYVIRPSRSGAAPPSRIVSGKTGTVLSGQGTIPLDALPGKEPSDE